MIRFEMAFGKAFAALALGRSSRLVRIRNEEKPAFMRYLIAATSSSRRAAACRSTMPAGKSSVRLG